FCVSSTPYVTTLTSFLLFFFYCYSHPRYLHSFPTRRSSDLLSPFSEGGRTPAPVRGPAESTARAPRIPRIRREGNRKIRGALAVDRKSTRLNSSHVAISYAVFCLKKKKKMRSSDIFRI